VRHGTAVAGVAAAGYVPGAPMLGVSPEAQIGAYKVGRDMAGETIATALPERAMTSLLADTGTEVPVGGIRYPCTVLLL
jgi:subtilisin family serine protease